jgi:putative transposase
VCVVPPKHKLPDRKHPDEGVLIFRGQVTIVFLTVCTAKRIPGLANPTVHAALLTAWHRADAWSVGFYLIMSDHIHLFCSPQNDDGKIEAWIAYWKREFRRVCGANFPRFQSRGFHHRLRREESYSEKWDYVRENPVRAGLVTDAEDWPYQGQLSDLYF